LPDPKGKLGPRIRDLQLPPGAVITLITRDNEVLIPKGNFRLQGWDRVTVLARIVEEDKVREALLKPFQQPDDEVPFDHEPGPKDHPPMTPPESSPRS